LVTCQLLMWRARFFCALLEGFHLLSLEDMSAGDARESLRRMSTTDDVEACLAEGGAYARASTHGRLGRMTASADTAVRLFAEARAARAKVERQAVAHRLATAAAAAAARLPLYGADLRRAVAAPHPVHGRGNTVVASLDVAALACLT
jgi:hypothetical protein